MLRAINLRAGDPHKAPYVPLGVNHSLRKADDLPLAPGEIAEIRITLLPISVRISKGHRIRVAIAGHDAALKTRYPKQGTPQLRILRNAAHASCLQLPVIVAMHP